MSVLVNIVIADEGDAEAIGASPKPVADWRGIEARGLDPAKFAMLHSILTGETFEEAEAEYGAAYAASDEGPWVIRIPGEAVEKLAAMEEDVLGQVGAELAATEVFEIDGWPPDEVQAILAELAALAESAVAQGKALFVWLGGAPGEK